MIPVHEIRIGNCYQSANGQWLQVTEEHLKSESFWKAVRQSLVPIPLTKDGLLKLGFVQSQSSTISHPTYVRLNMVLEQKENRFYYPYGTRLIPSLHLLQNIYLAVTGEILPIPGSSSTH